MRHEPGLNQQVALQDRMREAFDGVVVTRVRERHPRPYFDHYAGPLGESRAAVQAVGTDGTSRTAWRTRYAE